jgi:hypothetical protein
MNVYTSTGAVFKRRPEKALRKFLKELAKEKQKRGIS